MFLPVNAGDNQLLALLDLIDGVDRRAYISDTYIHNCLYTGAFVINIIKLVYLCIIPSATDVKTIKISAENQLVFVCRI